MFEVLGTWRPAYIFDYFFVLSSSSFTWERSSEACWWRAALCVPTEGCDTCSDSGFHTCAAGTLIHCCYDASYDQVIDLFN